MIYAALHPDSRLLLGSWRAINGMEAAKESDVAKPQDASFMAQRLFMAQRVAEGVFTFRTIGSDLKTWTGRDLRDHEVGSLFHGADKVLMRALLEASVSAPGPAMARIAAFGAGAGQRTDIEMVFLPLIEKGQVHRILGLFQPIAANITVSRPVLRFSITALLPPDPAMPVRPELRIVAKK